MLRSLVLPAPLPVPFRLLPERRCFANVGVEKCYLLHPPAPAARMGTPSLPPPIAAIQNWWSWKAPPLVGTLRDPYGTLTGPLGNYFRNTWQFAMTGGSLRELEMVRESCCPRRKFNVILMWVLPSGPGTLPEPSGTHVFHLAQRIKAT